jgi:hypothetical protein
MYGLDCSLLEIVAFGISPLVRLRSSLAPFIANQLPEPTVALTDCSKSHTEPRVFDVSVVEARNGRDGDGDETKERSEQGVGAGCKLSGRGRGWALRAYLQLVEERWLRCFRYGELRHDKLLGLVLALLLVLDLLVASGRLVAFFGNELDSRFTRV